VLDRAVWCGELSLLSQRPSSSAAAAPPVPPAPDAASVKVDATRCACKRLDEILQHLRDEHARHARTLPKCTRGNPDVCYENVNGTTSQKGHSISLVPSDFTFKHGERRSRESSIQTPSGSRAPEESTEDS
jgi:hypothetical protein